MIKKYSPEQIMKDFSVSYMRQLRSNVKKFSKTNGLYKSLKAKIISNNEMIVTTTVDYAQIQNFGGRIKITDKMRSAMWALFYKTGESIYKAIALTKKSFVTIKAKRFTNIDIDKILTKVIKRLHKLK